MNSNLVPCDSSSGKKRGIVAGWIVNTEKLVKIPTLRRQRTDSLVVVLLGHTHSWSYGQSVPNLDMAGTQERFKNGGDTLRVWGNDR